jgi:hypothetical protein
MFDGADNNVIGDTEPSPATADGIAARLEEIIKAEVAVYGAIDERWRPNPENVKALIELMKTLIPILLPLFL